MKKMKYRIFGTHKTEEMAERTVLELIECGIEAVRLGCTVYIKSAI